MGDHRRGADADERAGGTGDLYARAAEEGDEDAADDGGVEALLGADAGGDGQAHGERQSDDADEQAGREVR